MREFKNTNILTRLRHNVHAMDVMCQKSYRCFCYLKALSRWPGEAYQVSRALGIIKPKRLVLSIKTVLSVPTHESKMKHCIRITLYSVIITPILFLASFKNTKPGGRRSDPPRIPVILPVDSSKIEAPVTPS
jgi:hypothetical protein